jgi:hypothetical protein
MSGGRCWASTSSHRDSSSLIDTGILLGLAPSPSFIRADLTAASEREQTTDELVRTAPAEG